MAEDIKHTSNIENALSSDERERLIESIIDDIIDLTNSSSAIPDYDFSSTSNMM